MKYILPGLFVLLFVFNAFADSFTTQIHSVDHGKKGQKHLILLTNGHTAFIDSNQKSLIEAVEQSLENRDTVHISLDRKLNVISIQTVVPEREEPQNEITSEEIMSYDPSIISYTTAQNVFRNMRRDYQNDSQCYNRAHIWTFEEFKRSSLKSSKLFLFFTSRYIRRYNYKWWFHVTPMVYVGGTAQSNWRALDRRYTSGPLTTKTWTNIFMHNNALCPVVYKYSSYRNNQQSQDCYLIPTSMYFWQPRDIEREERTGYVKTQYFTSETNHAYWEAF
ncbi:MAG: hypothetical protein H0V66_12775 [Bdellovibrionales bacterium]|nr:hypothetical protein [Bdellovibrionales bacterium]